MQYPKGTFYDYILNKMSIVLSLELIIVENNKVNLYSIANKLLKVCNSYIN